MIIKEEGQGTLEKAYQAMSDYIEVYDYKPETFAGIKYAFTSKILIEVSRRGNLNLKIGSIRMMIIQFAILLLKRKLIGDSAFQH